MLLLCYVVVLDAWGSKGVTDADSLDHEAVVLEGQVTWTATCHRDTINLEIAHFSAYRVRAFTLLTVIRPCLNTILFIRHFEF